jgi:hypothetical protein
MRSRLEGKDSSLKVFVKTEKFLDKNIEGLQTIEKVG